MCERLLCVFLTRCESFDVCNRANVPYLFTLADGLKLKLAGEVWLNERSDEGMSWQENELMRGRRDERTNYRENEAQSRKESRKY